MAGTIPLSLTQQFDRLGNVLAGGKLYLIQAGTVSTPQSGYQDSALTIPWPNPIVLDDAGRLPQFFLADGSIKIRLADADGVTQVTADGILVVGASSGGGGGSPVDATTIFTTGDLKVTYGTGGLAGFVRANGRTIGNATSGASERANSDTSALYAFLWNADANLVVSTGRGASAAADYAANKTIALPDWRGRALAGLDDMGNSAAGRLTSGFFGATATVLGAAGGAESQTLTVAQLPTGITSSNTGAITLSVQTADKIAFGPNNGSATAGGTQLTTAVSGGTYGFVNSGGQLAIGIVNTTSNNTSGNAHPNVGPMMLATIYLKL
jgi:microcystin-dependent protein